MYQIVLIISALIMLSGCDTNPTRPGDTVYEGIPESLLVQCHVTVPPDPKAYVAATVDQREEKLQLDNLNVREDLRLCNIRLAKAAQLNQEKQKLFNKGNAGGK